MFALLLDFLPVLLFFAAYKLSDLMVATAVLIIATLVQTAITWARTRTVKKLNLVVAGLVLVFGGLTLLLDSEIWVKWKPTAVYWMFAAVFAGSEWIGAKSIVRRMFDTQMTLPDFAWRRLNFAWVAFFTLGGVLNLWVAYNFSTDTWVNFKLAAAIGLPLLFALAQGFYVARHATEAPEA